MATCFQFWFVAQAEEKPSSAQLTYNKVWKGSVPEYTQIVVDEDGVGTFDAHSLAQRPNPRPMKLSIATTRKLFELAAELNNFKSIDLESHRKVASLGLKTLTYEGNGENNQVQFNYTLQRQAQELVNIFDKVSTVEQHVSALDYGIKYDHLSLPHELWQIQIDLQNKALTDTELMVPELEQIVRDSRFLHLAQVRAQDILNQLQKNN